MDRRNLTVLFACLGGSVLLAQGMNRSNRNPPGRDNANNQPDAAPADQANQPDRQDPLWLRDENAPPPNGQLPSPDDLMPWNTPPAIPAAARMRPPGPTTAPTKTAPPAGQPGSAGSTINPGPGTGVVTAPSTGVNTVTRTGVNTAPGAFVNTAPGTGVVTAPSSAVMTASSTAVNTAPGTIVITAPSTGVITAPSSGVITAPSTGVNTAPGTGVNTAPGTGVDTAPSARPATQGTNLSSGSDILAKPPTPTTRPSH